MASPALAPPKPSPSGLSRLFASGVVLASALYCLRLLLVTGVSLPREAAAPPTIAATPDVVLPRAQARSLSRLLASPWVIFGTALGLRLLLAPVISHTWDTQTWWNVWGDLQAGSDPLHAIRLPYEHMQELSTMTRSEQKGLYYEYWAYPPGMLYIYYPLAKLYELLQPIRPAFSLAYSFAVVPLPLSFFFVHKLPNFVADLVIGAVLWRTAGPSSARWFLFNPYVLLVSVWNFESAMVACVMVSLYLYGKDRTTGSALALAFGASIKFVPAFLLPAFVIHLMMRPDATWKRTLLFCGVFAVALALLVAPAADLMPFVLSFHNARPGGGLSWQMVVHAMAAWRPGPGWDPYFLVYLGAIGDIILPLGMIAAIAYLCQRRLTLNQLCLAMTLAYLASTKLVNESYLLLPLVLMTVEIAKNGDALKRRIRALFWLIPFAWAMINVPWQGLIAYFMVSIHSLTPDDFKDWAAIHYLDAPPLLTILAVLGVICVGLYVWSFFLFTGTKPESDEPVAET